MRPISRSASGDNLADLLNLEVDLRSKCREAIHQIGDPANYLGRLEDIGVVCWIIENEHSNGVCSYEGCSTLSLIFYRLSVIILYQMLLVLS